VQSVMATSSAAVRRLGTVAFQLSPSACSGGASDDVTRVLVTGAAGQIAYSLIFMVANGAMLGPKRQIILHLLDIPAMKQSLEGLVLELEDCAFPLLKGVLATVDVQEAFKGVNIALLVGAFPRSPGMQRKDLLERNISIFRQQGQALNDFAAQDVKVVVVGNPANTNALIAMLSAPRIPKENFTALTRLDQNRAVAQIAKKLQVNCADVHNTIIWGNHSVTQYPDINHAWVLRRGQKVPVTALVDSQWATNYFIPAVQQRGAVVMNMRKKSSAASAAVAIVDHVRDWILGTEPGKIVSMGVASDGSYGIPPGVIFSMPVSCANGSYRIFPNLTIDAASREYLRKTHEELEAEREAAVTFLRSQ
jgi:malate dehydrogenase